MSQPDAAASSVSVPPERLARWVENFFQRHGGPAMLDEGGSGRTVAADGSWFELRSCFIDAAVTYTGGVEESHEVLVPDDWGVLVVRKGGFAVARLHGAQQTSSKVGRRHVQGRTKAGGQSQQRFSRRRDNQARAAYEAAADHAATHLSGLDGPLLTGGDEAAVVQTLGDARLRSARRGLHFGDVVEPRRDTLDALVARCLAWRVTVFNSDQTPQPGQ